MKWNEIIIKEVIIHFKLNVRLKFNIHSSFTKLHACVSVKSLSRVQLFATLWTVALHDPLSMGFSRQEYWSGLPCPLPGDLPDPGIEPAPLKSPALTDWIFTISATWEVPQSHMKSLLHVVLLLMMKKRISP